MPTNIEVRANQLAQEHLQSSRVPAKGSVLARLSDIEACITDSVRQFSKGSEDMLRRSSAAEWMLDNHYIVDQTFRQIREDMPKGFYNSLPMLAESPQRSIPRVYTLCGALTEESGNSLNSENLTAFIAEYQRKVQLTIAELWAVPTFLRFSILESLSRALEEPGQPENAEAQQHLSQDDAVVANCILSLRFLSTTRWQTFFDQNSVVEQILCTDPADVYSHMDFATRDRYRKLIEELSHTAHLPEPMVAKSAIELARKGTDSPSDHVGFYLFGAGRKQLQQKLDYHIPWMIRLRSMVFENPTSTYLGSIWLIVALLQFGVISFLVSHNQQVWVSALTIALTIVPSLTLAVNLVNWILSHTLRPRLLSKMDFSKGIPAEWSTAVVIPSLLTDPEEIQSLFQQMEQHFLGNADPNIHFCLLTDFTDAPDENMAEDEAYLQMAERLYHELCRKYAEQKGCNFYFFNRRRLWNKSEQCWMGWERKRGKLQEFNHLVRGDRETNFTYILGDISRLRDVRFVITLDVDTIMPRDTANRLIATLAHPLNQPRFGPKGDRIAAGYTVLQPRIEVNPTSTRRTFFSRVFTQDVALDLYSRAVSDVYQDLFAEGIYVGKGIYDIDAFERCLKGRVPENTLLSHDLFEGAHGRAGLVTDIIFFEEYPPNYLAYARRWHRWVRGDWQISPWIFPRAPHEGHGRVSNRLSMISRWRIFDNIRRSLNPPSLIALFMAAWLGLPGEVWVWTLIGVTFTILPIFLDLMNSIYHRLLQKGPRWVRPSGEYIRWLLSLAFLPYEAILSMDAIVSVIIRSLITHRHMLQWSTAAHTNLFFGKTWKIKVTWQQMSGSPVFALLIMVLILAFNRPAFLVASPLILTWFLAPQIAYRITVTKPIPQQTISRKEKQEIRQLARRTWFFFERFVGSDDNWLPPDRYQEDPRGIVAHATSPTNIGMMLTSTLAAYELGYIGNIELTLRIEDTFETLKKMERYRGHFYNWYETRTLKPLPPRYVSTVDSGNLAASFLALATGMRELTEQPPCRWDKWKGLLDTLGILEEIIPEDERREDGTETSQPNILRRIITQILEVKSKPEQWYRLLQSLIDEGLPELEKFIISYVEADDEDLDARTIGDLRMWSERVHYHIVDMQRELEILCPWLPMIHRPPSLFSILADDSEIVTTWKSFLKALSLHLALRQIPQACKKAQGIIKQLEAELGAIGTQVKEVEEARQWCEQIKAELISGRMNTEALIFAFQKISHQSEEFFNELDFSFLFNTQRQIFHIGFNADLDELDRNFYDLLISEARVASLIAIAKGEVPQKHWLYLSRPFTLINDQQALLSWSGTMFEYLMPILFLNQDRQTLLDQSCRVAVDRQISYAEQKSIPWGISESGYYQLDVNQNYQYRAFGVPGLGYKRGLEDDLVITPYASLLALPFKPASVHKNLQRLKNLGMLGCCGLYEAVDFTRSRLALGQKFGIAKTYMAHHQGMILLSITNFLTSGVITRRLHSHPLIQSIELLLQEHVPTSAQFEFPHLKQGKVIRPERKPLLYHHWRVQTEPSYTNLHCMTNGRYTVVLSNSGGGYSTWENTALTRWRPDTNRDAFGTWIYLQDRDSGETWSAGFQPTCVHPQSQEVLYAPHEAEFRRHDKDIATRMMVTVAPYHDVEIRRLSLTNHGSKTHHLRVMSYGEVILDDGNADLRHPAFNNLFIESEFLPEFDALLFKRRKRSPKEEEVYLVHKLVGESPLPSPLQYETSRCNFIGRCENIQSPAALKADSKGLSNSVNTDFDPIFSLCTDIDLPPNQITNLAFLTIAGNNRQEVIDAATHFHPWIEIQQAFERASSESKSELRQLGLTAVNVERILKLLTLMLLPQPTLRAPASTLVSNQKNQSGLWTFGISGDDPILLCRIHTPDQTDLVRDLLRAHAYWRNRKVKVDLVFLNTYDTGYTQVAQEHIYWLIQNTGSEPWLNRHGGIYILRAENIPEQDITLLETSARAILDGNKGSFADQIRMILPRLGPLPLLTPTLTSFRQEKTLPLERPQGLAFDNGYGGFSQDGKEYVIFLEPGKSTPAPWVNVIANPNFGTLVSESSLGCTWAINSGENRLTPWHNDPVCDPSGEAIYIRDEETGQFWSPTPLPARDDGAYLIRHGAGYTIYEHRSCSLDQTLRVFVDPYAPIKIFHLTLKNISQRHRRISITSYVEWTLGTTRSTMQPFIAPEYIPERHALLARNPFHMEFGERVAFLASDLPPYSLTTDRLEFIGRQGSLSSPAILRRASLSGEVNPGSDPCAALHVAISLAPGEEKSTFFLLGQGSDKNETLKHIEHFLEPRQVERSWVNARALWDDVLNKISVKTPDRAMDFMLNRWLLYQALSCRIWGRTAFYQSSGAYGFRDQIQDVLSVLYAAPYLLREQILRCAGSQFEEGDVLHWWHPPHRRGIRSRCSDDLLWLPYVTAHYVKASGDYNVLNEIIPFLKAEPLQAGEYERYGTFTPGVGGYTLYDHCLRALDKGLTRGMHGIPLMGSSDWNDGFSLVGKEGQGESVWLGWFLITCLEEFAPICERWGDVPMVKRFRKEAQILKSALESNAWDGDWYLRAFYDDGSPMGSVGNEECAIDAIAQSWSVISGGAEADRARQAMESTKKHLIKEEDGIIQLFAPPFDKSHQEPGYIKGYPPGVRENGGQYTHGAIWSAWAYTLMGDGEQAGRLFQMLNPINHSDTADKAELYRVEPYAIAADIASTPPHKGQGGWTWYTGSAGWMYRLGIERILGIQLIENHLHFDPCIPPAWEGFSASIRLGESTYEVSVENPKGAAKGVKELWVDGKKQKEITLPMEANPGKHTVRVVLG